MGRRSTVTRGIDDFTCPILLIGGPPAVPEAPNPGAGEAENDGGRFPAAARQHPAGRVTEHRHHGAVPLGEFLGVGHRPFDDGEAEPARPAIEERPHLVAQAAPVLRDELDPCHRGRAIVGVALRPGTTIVLLVLLIAIMAAFVVFGFPLFTSSP